MRQGHTAPQGSLSLVHQRDLGDLRLRKPDARWTLKNFMANRRRSVGQVAAAKLMGSIFGLVTGRAELKAQVFSIDWSRLAPWQAVNLRALLEANEPVQELPRYFGGFVTDYGVMSRRLVTDTGVAFIVDAFQNSVELENMKFHGFGIGTTAESAAQTALITELTTEYATDNTRPTGSTTEGATANIYRTVGTLSPDSGGTIAITEHGIFSQAANSGGVMLDRSKFSAVNVVASSDSIQATYELTFASGG